MKGFQKEKGKERACTSMGTSLPRSSGEGDVHQTDSLFVGVRIDHVRLQEVQDAPHRTLFLFEGDAIAAEDAPFLLLPRRTILMNP